MAMLFASVKSASILLFKTTETAKPQQFLDYNRLAGAIGVYSAFRQHYPAIAVRRH